MFIFPTILPHPPLIDNYAHAMHHRDDRNTLSHLTLRILSYCDDNTRYTAATTLDQLQLQVQTSLDRAGDFSLVTKLGRKHKKCNVAIINSDPDDTPPTFTSVAWSYDHEAPFTCVVVTHLQSLHHHELTDNPLPSAHTDEDEHEFNHDNILTTPAPSTFFGIKTTLTADITQSAQSSLQQAHIRLLQTTRQQYTIVTIQRLLTALVHSVCGYNPLCTLIPITQCLAFDKKVHHTYRRTTKSTITQPSHATFLDRTHHGLHIPSLLVNQLKSRARELDVRLNSADANQHAPPRARLAALKQNHRGTPNLINNATLSLSQYGFHLRDADHPVITLILQDLLHNDPDAHLLGLPPNSSSITDSSPFTLLGHSRARTPYAHRQELHNWLITVLTDPAPNPITNDHLERHDPVPLFLDTDDLIRLVNTAHQTVHMDLHHFLTYAEWYPAIASPSSSPTTSPTSPSSND